jgi:long-chain acyl-CoA synthetase
MDRLYTCAEIIDRLEKYPSDPKAFNTQCQKGWKTLSTAEFLQSVKFVALGLQAIGMQRGDRVGILANPSTEWTIVDLAIMIAGGVSVPLFANISDEHFVYEAKEAGLHILFIEGSEQWAMYERHASLFKTVVNMSSHTHPDHALLLPDLMEKGRHVDGENPALYQTMRDQIKPSDLGSLIYTSGSTGTPKGVELTHENLTCILNFDKFHWHPQQDCYLSVLPLAHVFGHFINLWVLTWGARVYYSVDYKNLGVICREVKPTAIVVVPRLLEKIYAKIEDQLHHTTGFKHWIGKWAFKLAKSKKLSIFQKMLFPLADLLVFSKFRHALGGHIRIVICGGAALNPQLESFFDRIGINIYEGWGLTEACPVTVNRPDNHKPGTVGLPAKGQEIKISPEGEVLVKGPLVMRGYHKDPELTAKTIDEEKWLHTGDRGSIDKEGFLTILGRIKELYKTSTGEYVAPVPIEQALASYPLIDMSMVIAEGRKFTSCLLFPNHEVLQRMKNQQQAGQLSDEAFLQSRMIKGEIDKLIRETNKHLNHWEKIHAYRFVLEPLSIQSGELTPSMKIRREVVAKKYSRLIDQMYEE